MYLVHLYQLLFLCCFVMGLFSGSPFVLFMFRYRVQGVVELDLCADEDSLDSDGRSEEDGYPFASFFVSSAPFRQLSQTAGMLC